MEMRQFFEKTVEKEILELLFNLCKLEELKSFFLVGGTALALQEGFRKKSIDIDLFAREDFDVDSLNLVLKKKFGFVPDQMIKNTLCGNINGVDIDLIKYDYPLIAKPFSFGNATVLDELDIACMKMSAIKDSGTRMKDFVDMDFLLGKYSLEELCVCFCEKYYFSKKEILIAIRALAYFDDISESEKVVLTNGSFDFEKVKARLCMAVASPEDEEQGSGSAYCREHVPYMIRRHHAQHALG